MESALKYQFATFGLIALILSACGGGGGSGGTSSSEVSVKTDTANAADGLGDAGHVAGTMELGFAALPKFLRYRPAIAVALSDQGQALAAWHVFAPVAGQDSASWAQASLDGKWSAAQPIPQVRNIDSSYGMTLRMNTAGNAVLGWVNQGEGPISSPEKWAYRATRFIQNQGWEAKVYDAGGSSHATSVNTWDLAMLDDNSFTASIRLSMASRASSAVQKTEPDGKQSVRFQSTEQYAIGSYSDAAFTPKSKDGFGLLYQLSDSLIKPGQIDIRVRMANIYLSDFLAFPVGTYPGLCFTDAHDGGLVAAGSPHTGGVLAALVANELPNGMITCETNNLQVSRIHTRDRLGVDSIRLSTESNSVPIAPALAVDQSNNALIIWKEVSGRAFDDGVPVPARLMWSQSLKGGAWTTPAAIDLSAFGTLTRLGHIALAMNDSGDAVVSLKLNDRNNSYWNEMMVLGRFNFSSGWAPWRTIANKVEMSDPQVAINAYGKAVAVYTGLPTTRVGGKVPNGYSGELLPRAYAYLF